MSASSKPPPSESSESTISPGPSAYHESTQFRDWRFSPTSLEKLRSELNSRSVNVAKNNQELEKEAQKSLGHDISDPAPPTAYLTVPDELLLLRFYCSQISRICREGFGLPEVVEATAITYVKRFYLKNSVMEWHPKVIMPTCLFLAAKTTNFPVPVDQFVSRIPKLTAEDVLEKEFLVAQSLGFQFWVRGAHKPLRGWGLDIQDQPNPPIETINKALPVALAHLSTSSLTDAEFIYTPSQIALACWRMADKGLVESFLDQQYAAAAEKHLRDERLEEDDAASPPSPLYHMEQHRLLEILDQIETIISTGGGSIEVKKVKDVDKRLRQCTNPEKVPGTALYIKRKQEKEAAEASSKAAKSLKARASVAESESVFGGALTSSRLPLSPRVNSNGNGTSDGMASNPRT